MNVLPWEDSEEGRKPSAEPYWEAEVDGALEQQFSNVAAYCSHLESFQKYGCLASPLEMLIELSWHVARVLGVLKVTQVILIYSQF